MLRGCSFFILTCMLWCIFPLRHKNSFTKMEIVPLDRIFLYSYQKNLGSRVRFKILTETFKCYLFLIEHFRDDEESMERF